MTARSTRRTALSVTRPLGRRRAGYGRFLIDVFEEWVRHDVGTVFVQMFDAALANWVGVAAAAVRALRDVRARARARAQRRPLLVRSLRRARLPARQHRRARRWSSSSPPSASRRSARTSATRCRRTAVACDVRFACNGGCPKDRFTHTPAGEPGLNYLCPSYQAVLRARRTPMQAMAELLQGRPRAVRDHGRVRRAGRPPGAQRPVHLRQRAQMEALPRRPRRGGHPIERRRMLMPIRSDPSGPCFEGMSRPSPSKS